jgi:hypothetical protein
MRNTPSKGIKFFEKKLIKVNRQIEEYRRAAKILEERDNVSVDEIDFFLTDFEYWLQQREHCKAMISLLKMQFKRGAIWN